MLIYKTADKTDTLSITILVEEYCKEHKIPYNPTDLDKTIRNYIHNFNIILAEDDGKPLGAICYTVAPNPYNYKELLGRKMAIFVKSEERDEGIGYTLVHLAEEDCKEQGATKFFFSSPKTVKGYEVFETDYVKEL